MSKPFFLFIFIAIAALTSCFAQTTPQPEPPVSPLLGTATRPLVPTYTPTATFTPTPMPTATPLPAPTVPNYFQFTKIKPICTLATDYALCYDQILDISFEYPTEWGIITATFGSAVGAPNNSGFAGYGYAYQFGNNFAKPHPNGFTTVIGSGRSLDFSQPRDGWIGDFSGFREKTTETFCENFPPPALCSVIKPGVILVFMLTEVEQFCEPMPGLPPLTGAVYINLPERRLINGFVFAYPLLSQQRENDLYDILGLAQSFNSTKCKDEQARQLFDLRIKQLADEILSRTGSDDVMLVVNMLTRLANSIQGQETSR